MKEKEMEIIAGWFNDVIGDINNENKQKEIAKKVKELCESFPIY